jgi:hypothetical protein
MEAFACAGRRRELGSPRQRCTERPPVTSQTSWRMQAHIFCPILPHHSTLNAGQGLLWQTEPRDSAVMEIRCQSDGYLPAAHTHPRCAYLFQKSGDVSIRSWLLFPRRRSSKLSGRLANAVHCDASSGAFCQTEIAAPFRKRR